MKQNNIEVNWLTSVRERFGLLASDESKSLANDQENQKPDKPRLFIWPDNKNSLEIQRLIDLAG